VSEPSVPQRATAVKDTAVTVSRATIPSWALSSRVATLVAVIGFVYTVAGPLLPGLGSEPSWSRLAALVASLLVVIIWALRNILQTAQACWYRIAWFSRVYDDAEYFEEALNEQKQSMIELTSKLRQEQDFRQDMISELEEATQFNQVLSNLVVSLDQTLPRVAVVDAIKRDGELFLIMENSSRINDTDILLVVDKDLLEYFNELRFLGIYKVVRSINQAYVAQAIFANSVWEGLLHQEIDAGRATLVNTKAIAILVAQRGEGL